MKTTIIILIISFILIPQAIARPLVFFSPNDSCDKKIIGYINKAKKTIEVSVYSFKHEDIASALVSAHDRGVLVRVMVDKQQARKSYSVNKKLENAGIPVIRDTHNGLMHNKFVIIDSKKVITGSYNWTKDAAQENDENIIVLDDAGAEYKKHFNYLWRKMAEDTMERLYPIRMGDFRAKRQDEYFLSYNLYFNKEFGYAYYDSLFPYEYYYTITDMYSRDGSTISFADFIKEKGVKMPASEIELNEKALIRNREIQKKEAKQRAIDRSMNPAWEERTIKRAYNIKKDK